MSEPITFLIADDDEMYRDYTISQLVFIPDMKCIGVCENAIMTREQLKHLQPDLLILDIEMPGLNGIDLAKSLDRLPLTIFITSHPNFAVDAFELDAVDYLLKPVSNERMLRSIDKVKNLIAIKKNTQPAEAFQKNDNNSFFIKEKNMFIKIGFIDVTYAESLGDFVNIYLESGDKKIVLVSLKNLEQQLPSDTFLRISRSHIVNKNKVTAIDNETLKIDNIQLTIGKTYSDIVLNNIIGNQAIKRFI